MCTVLIISTTDINGPISEDNWLAGFGGRTDEGDLGGAAQEEEEVAETVRNSQPDI